MDKRAKQIRNKVRWKLDRISNLEEEIDRLKHDVALLEVEYEEETGELLLTRDRTRVAPLS